MTGMLDYNTVAERPILSSSTQSSDVESEPPDDKLETLQIGLRMLIM